MRALRFLAPALVVVALVVVSAACGSSKITTSDRPPDPNASLPPPVIILTARGVDQVVLHVFEGHATIINNDTRDHALFRDPHPTHDPFPGDCSVPNVGVVAAGSRVELTNLRPSLCFFHEESAPTDQAFKFSVLVH